MTPTPPQAGERAEAFTPQQLAKFADMATRRAEKNAAKMWPPGHAREVTVRNLQARYYAEYVTPTKPTCAQQVAALTVRMEKAEADARIYSAALARAIPHLPTQSLRDEFAVALDSEESK